MENRATVVPFKPPQARGAPDHAEAVRIAEALLFASAEPLSSQELAARLPEGGDIEAVLADLVEHYAPRGVNLVRIAGKWSFRTSSDLAFLLARDVVEPRKLSRAAMETLAIVAYHQPVTRAEIEEIRGVATSKGTLDTLLEAGWIRPKGRRRTPGRPVTWVATSAFLDHFGLESSDALPGLEELKAAGLLDARATVALGDRTAEAAEDDEDEDSDAGGALDESAFADLPD